MMLRSVTVANILNYDGEENREVDNFRKIPIYLLIAVGAIEFLLSSLFFSFPAFFLDFAGVEDFDKVRVYFWIIVVFVTVHSIFGALTRCLCEYYENTEHYRYYLVSVAIILHIFLFTCSKIDLIFYHVFAYGVLGGVTSSYISNFLQYFLEEEYDLEQNVYFGITQLAKALSLLVIPVSATFVIQTYTWSGSLEILSGFIANIIPCLLLVRKNKLWDHFRFTNVPLRTTDNLEDMTELTPINVHKEEKQLEVEDDGVFWQEDEEAPQDELNINYMNAVQNYYSTMFGVNILPSIDEETDEDINEITTKRLSQITAKLEELNRSETKSTISNNQINIKERQPEPEHQNEVYFQEIKRRSCCTPYKTYLWKRRWRKFVEFLSYNFAIPLFRSLTNLYFYPPLISKSANLLIATSFLTLMPYIYLKEMKKGYYEAIFVLVYSGFTWCFFLLTLPILLTLSNIKIRVIHICGYIILVICFIVLSKPITNNLIILSCMLFGLGFGITNYTENIVYRDFLGARQWRDSKGSLNTFSAILFIVYYTIMDNFDLDYKCMFKYSMYVYFANILTWSIVPVLKSMIKWLRKYCRRKREDDFFS